MNKNVLVLSASPRRNGNSETLCDELMKGALESDNQVKKIFMRDMEINYCIGCEACQNNGGNCGHKDDVAEILEKMIAADVIVMATPVYFYTMNAQMKALIDRTVARYTEIKNKEFYFIITAAVESKQRLERTLEGFRGFTDCLTGAQEKGVVYGTSAWKKGDIEGSPAMELAYDFGKNI